MRWPFLIILFGCSNILYGQFSEVQLPTAGVIGTISCDDSGCYASDNLEKVFFSDDLFHTWTSTSVPLGNNGNKLKFERWNDSTWYYLLGSGGGSGFRHSILRTQDSGETWDTLIAVLGALSDFAINNDSIIVTVGSFGKTHLSTNGGITWLDLTSGTDQYFVVKFFGDSSLIVGGFQRTFSTLDLFGSGFGATTGPGFFSRSIAFNGTGRSFLATSTNQWNQATIYRSTNWGDTWERINFWTAYSIWQLAFRDSLVGFACGHYLAKDTGMVFTTIDGGETWDTKLRVPTNEQIISIAVANDTAVLLGTTGGKLFRWNPTQWTTDLAAETPPFSLSLQPNPASSIQELSITSDHYGEARITVYDMQSRILVQTPTAVIQPGENSISLDLSTWPAGIYVYQVEMDGEVVILKGQVE